MPSHGRRHRLLCRLARLLPTSESDLHWQERSWTQNSQCYCLTADLSAVTGQHSFEPRPREGVRPLPGKLSGENKDLFPANCEKASSRPRPSTGHLLLLVVGTAPPSQAAHLPVSTRSFTAHHICNRCPARCPIAFCSLSPSSPARIVLRSATRVSIAIVCTRRVTPPRPTTSRDQQTTTITNALQEPLLSISTAP